MCVVRILQHTWQLPAGKNLGTGKSLGTHAWIGSTLAAKHSASLQQLVTIMYSARFGAAVCCRHHWLGITDLLTDGTAWPDAGSARQTELQAVQVLLVLSRMIGIGRAGGLDRPLLACSLHKSVPATKSSARSCEVDALLFLLHFLSA